MGRTRHDVLDYCLAQWETEFQPRRISPTVRQYFYLCATAGLVEKSDKGYDRVQWALARARERGVFPWEAVYDGLRQLKKPNVYSSLASYLGIVRRAYSLNKWQDQPRRVEVWIEKDTVRGTVESVVERWEVPLLIDRGYTSLSAKKQAVERLRGYEEDGATAVIIYIGDHDPSGINMLEEARDWLDDASDGVDFEVARIAVTDEDHDDERFMQLPVNRRDSRAEGYIDRFGDGVLEVEAIAPQELQDRLSAAIESYIDDELWDAAVEKEEAHLAKIEAWVAEAEQGEKE